MRLTALPCVGLISLNDGTPFCSSDGGTGIKLQACGSIHDVYKMVSNFAVTQLNSYLPSMFRSCKYLKTLLVDVHDTVRCPGPTLLHPGNSQACTRLPFLALLIR